MATLNELSSSVQNLGKQYAAVIKVGEFLSGLASLDNLGNEIEARVEKLKQAEAVAIDKLSAAEAEAHQQVELNKASVDSANAAADDIVAEAKRIALVITGEAVQKADENYAVMAKRGEDFEKQWRASHAALAAAEAATAVAQQRLEELNSQIETVREKFA